MRCSSVMRVDSLACCISPSIRACSRKSTTTRSTFKIDGENSVFPGQSPPIPLINTPGWMSSKDRMLACFFAAVAVVMICAPLSVLRFHARADSVSGVFLRLCVNLFMAMGSMS